MSYLWIILSFISSLGLAILVIPRILVIAKQHSLYDPLDERKTHKGLVPRIGGLAFVPCGLFSLTFTFGIYYMYSGDSQSVSFMPNESELYFLFCGLLLLYLGGVKDDLVGLRYRYKFFIQFVSSAIIMFSGLYINNLHGLLGIYEIPLWISYPLTLIMLVFIINSINLIDGLDGLASSISIFALCVYGSLFYFQGLWFYSVIAVSMIGVLTIFFYYNVFGNVKKGRKLFMGDSGSLTIGFILGFLAIRYACYEPELIKPVKNMLVIAFSPLLVPLLDVLRVILSRIKRHKNIFKPDRFHIHHKLMNLYPNPPLVLIILICISSCLCLLNFILTEYCNSTVIIRIDIAIWTSINLYFTYMLKKRNPEASISTQSPPPLIK